MHELLTKPRVLVVSGIYPDARRPFHGAWIHKHVRQLILAGCEVQVLTTQCLTVAAYFRSPLQALHTINAWLCTARMDQTWEGIPVHVARFHLGLPTQFPLLAPRLALRAIRPVLARIREQFPFDLMLAWTGEFLALAASRAARELGVPFVSTAIGSDVNLVCSSPRGLCYRVERKLFLNSDRVLCVSRDLLEKVRTMTGGQARAQVFYPGLDTNLFRKDEPLRRAGRRKLGFGDSDKVLAFAGNLKAAKGVFDLLEAFARVASVDASLRLLLVGEPVAHQRLKRSIQQLGLAGRVTLTGGVDPGEMPGLLNAADLFVFPSWMEGLPNAVMEACACELPVIATRVGGIPELIEDGVTGVLVESRDPAVLARQITVMLQAPEQAAAMARAARMKMQEQFCWLKNGRKLLAIVQDSLGERRHVMAGGL